MDNSPRATITLPNVLRAYADGQSTIECQGATVSELLDHLTTRFPAIRARILTDDGQIRRFVNIYLDDEDIRALQGPDTAVTSASTLTILSAVAGG